MNQYLKNNTRKLIFGFLALLVTVLLDQGSKLWVLENLKGKPNIVWIPGVFELSYVENRGIAFGLFQGMQWIFVVLTVVILGMSLFVYLKMKVTRRRLPVAVVLLLLAGGAIGNMIDRVFRGYVVDFFYFSLIDFPVFNVADCFVTVAAFLLIILLLFVYKEKETDDFLQEVFPRKKARRRDR